MAGRRLRVVVAIAAVLLGTAGSPSARAAEGGILDKLSAKGPPAKPPATRIDVSVPKGRDAAEVRAVVEARLRLAGITVLDVGPKSMAKAIRVRVRGYHKADHLRALLEHGEVLSVYLVDDDSPRWDDVPLRTPRGGEHRTEVMDKWHKSHTLVDPKGSSLAADLAALAAPPGRRWIAGKAADGSGATVAVLAVDPPTLTALMVVEAHATAATKDAGGRGVYFVLRPEDARRFMDVTAVHTGKRIAIALGEDLVLAAKVAATITDGRFLINMGADPSAGGAVALVARLIRTGAPSGLRIEATLE